MSTPNSSGRFSIIPARAVDDNRLEPAALLVLMTIGTYGDRDGYCYPSQQTIGDRIGVSRTAVARQVKILHNLGYLAIERKWDEKTQKTHNTYKILFDGELNQEQLRSKPKREKNIEQTDVTHDVTSLEPFEPTDVTWIPQTDVTSGCITNVPLTPHLFNMDGAKSEGGMNTDEYKERIKAAYLRGLEEHRGKVDVARYPEDVQKTLQEFCTLWHMEPPRFAKRNNSESVDWIMGAREINDACGEFGIDLLRLYADEFEKYKDTHQGLAPYRVTRPGSLIKSLRGLAAEIRARGCEAAALQSQKDYGIQFDN